MTLIEFFEKDAIENICSSLASIPDRVVFLIGDDFEKKQKRINNNYKEIFYKRWGKDTVELVSLKINKNNIQEMIEKISSLVEKYGDCTFDLTGGEDLYLFATGVVAERYKDRNIQMHRFNIRNNTVIDCDQDGNIISTENPFALSVEENVLIYGGDIVYDSDEKGKTYVWDMNDDFKNDINKIWNVCRRNVRLWNTLIGAFKAAHEVSGYSEDLTCSVPVIKVIETLERKGGAFILNEKVSERILCELCNAGLLKDYFFDEEEFCVTYKNAQVKRCLTVEGQALEMKMFLVALDDCKETYNYVMNGVHIDWDGKRDESEFDTENEIDIMMMHGMVPVFVSCKNGSFDSNELYKLNTVATRFGGKYAKKVLLATALDNSDASNFLRQRARDMGINLIEGNGQGKKLVDMDDAELKKIMNSLLSN